ncbi:MAG: NUDIX domain-containing protein [Micromonosporaceae bacterium]|nr:NUDIX domain-containing protein [Micromonosporaceae bacterium]
MRQDRRIAAYGVCRDPDGRVLLVRRRGGSDWSLPGGGVEHGEAPRDALVREFREETGFTVEIIRLATVASDLAADPRRRRVVHTDRIIYDVRVTGGTLRDEMGGTSDRAEWFGPEQLPGLAVMPFVADVLSLTIVESPAPVPAARPTGRDPAATRVQRFAAYGLVTDPAGRLLLTRIAPGYPGAGRWHLPGGGTDFGEQPGAALVREIAEETGQRARVTDLLDVTHFHNPSAYGPERRRLSWHTVRTLYRAVVDAPTVPAVTEVDGSTAEAGWFAPAEVTGLDLNDFASLAVRRYL